MEALRDSGDDAEVIQAVLPLTRHPDSRLREKAAKVLRPAASQPDVQAVLVKLLEDRSDGVRKEAIIALRSDLPQSDIRLLRKIISGEKKQDEWQEATQTLKLLLEAWETRLANPKRAGR